MFVHFHSLTRPLSGSVVDTGTSLSCYYFTPRRFYAERRSPSNHYEQLDVQTNASAKEIKSAFYKLSKKHHPDVNPDDVHAAKKFSVISNAYDILGDPVKRREYDSTLSSRPTGYESQTMNNRTNPYAQRARAHRAAAWRAPFASSTSEARDGFQGAGGDFGNSRSSSYGSTHRYRGTSWDESTRREEYEEFYRAHPDGFGQQTQTENAAEEEREEEQQPVENVNRFTLTKLGVLLVSLSLAYFGFFTSSLWHEMHFEQPTSEFHSRLIKIPRASKNRTYASTSEKP